MKIPFNIKNLETILFLSAAITLLPLTLEAQRMQHRGGGGNRAATRPAGGAPNRSINGGSQRPANYNMNRQKPSQQPSQRPAYNNKASKPNQKPSNANVKDRSNSKNKPATRDVPSNRPSTGTKDNPNRGSGGKNINTGDRNVNVNNRNTNINVNRNVYVRPAPRPYPYPPHVYGGFRYYSYHPYHYHPYRPYYWGPAWHPWGFFVATMATTAIIISIQNQQYYYNQGVYYVSSNDGYEVVPAPIGATVEELPAETQTVVVNETTNNYYYGGTYYEKDEDGYTVVPPTAGTIVENLPEGGEQVKIGDITYVKFGDIYYQPVLIDGQNMYEVVEVEPES